ncbi:hypothetical protein, partial [Escherichia coli]|uniref:hypothetical protein n=1 Tax=Escherichia coli TaxID=562 RepID=UPI00374DF248
GAKDENTGAGLCRSRLVVQERLGHYNDAQYIQRDYRQHGYIRVGDYSLSIFNLLSLNNRLNTIR